MFEEHARYEWDDWLAQLVYRSKGPLLVEIVNDTSSMVRGTEVGVAGSICHSGCIAPHDRETCRLNFGAPSLLLARVSGLGFLEFSDHEPPFEELPVQVLWRTHGSMELHVTDGGFVLDGGFSDDFP